MRSVAASRTSTPVAASQPPPHVRLVELEDERVGPQARDVDCACRTLRAGRRTRSSGRSSRASSSSRTCFSQSFWAKVFSAASKSLSASAAVDAVAGEPEERAGDVQEPAILGGVVVAVHVTGRSRGRARAAARPSPAAPGPCPRSGRVRCSSGSRGCRRATATPGRAGRCASADR